MFGGGGILGAHDRGQLAQNDVFAGNMHKTSRSLRFFSAVCTAKKMKFFWLRTIFG
jgi:hypothetical protein